MHPSTLSLDLDGMVATPSPEQEQRASHGWRAVTGCQNCWNSRAPKIGPAKEGSGRTTRSTSASACRLPRVSQGAKTAPAGNSSSQVTLTKSTPSRAGRRADQRMLAGRQCTESAATSATVLPPFGPDLKPKAAACLGTFAHTRSPVRLARAAVLKHRRIPAVFEHPAAQPLSTSRLT